jgi:Leucine-rich repeat (LRR) protein
LRYLNLSGNNLTGLPYELGNLKNLEVLNLTGNSYAKADLAIIKQGLPSTVNIIGE